MTKRQAEMMAHRYTVRDQVDYVVIRHEISKRYDCCRPENWPDARSHGWRIVGRGRA